MTEPKSSIESKTNTEPKTGTAPVSSVALPTHDILDAEIQSAFDQTERAPR